MRALPAILLVLGSTIAAAQGYPGGGEMGGRGGMGGGRGGPGGGMGSRPSAPPNPTAKDVQKQDPVLLLLDKKKTFDMLEKQLEKSDDMMRDRSRSNAQPSLTVPPNADETGSRSPRGFRHRLQT